MTQRMRRLALLMVVLLATSCGGDSSSESSGPVKPFKGHVSVGHHRSLYMECRGGGAPTVVLEAGLTGDLHEWDAVAPNLSRQTRVCRYDRANIGESDATTSWRTGEDVVSDLHAALWAEGEHPPFVLVGFSFGGLFTQLYAATHPDEVAGVVLIESNHPDESDQFYAHLTAAQIAEDRKYANQNSEGIKIFTSLRQTQAAIGGFPDVPVVVVTAGHSDSDTWPPGWNPRLFDRLRARQQQDLTTLGSTGSQIVATHSGHDVPNEEPAIVIRAVKQVLRETD
jgi:pimeloyl-ACP methyl ester carboxylesterase